MKFLSFYLCSAIISLASSSPSSLVVRNLPGASSHDTITAVARSLHLMSRASETVFKNSTSFARTLKNATLLSLSR